MQTSWEAASEQVAAWTAAGEIGKVRVEVPPIGEAVKRFLEDAEARHLGWQTIKKYRHLLEKRLLTWCAAKGFGFFKQVDVNQLRAFRMTVRCTPRRTSSVYARSSGFAIRLAGSPRIPRFP